MLIEKLRIRLTVSKLKKEDTHEDEQDVHDDGLAATNHVSILTHRKQSFTE